VGLPDEAADPLIGAALPRIAPPRPLHHKADEMGALAERLGRPLWPWQGSCAEYLTAYVGDQWLFPEVAVVAARQNGKSSLLEPLIIERMLMGQRVMHTAQNRELPRETHDVVATLLKDHFGELIPERRGIRYGAGQEEIRLTTGGKYRIVAPTRSGARGQPNDLVIVDEVLEMEDFDFISAAKPTLIASSRPQIVYLSNAGHSLSAVLNALRARAGTDPSLAYLEWSATPDRAPDDRNGWAEANPSIGHNPATLPNLEREYRANVLGGTMDVWEREHLCRWTVSKTERLITSEVWQSQDQLAERPKPVYPAMGIKMDPSGDRVSAVLAWPTGDETVTLDVVVDVTGDPIDVDRLGPEIGALAVEWRVAAVAFDPATDADLVRHIPRNRVPINGRDYANATERFVRLSAGRRFLVHDPTDIIAGDLEHTTSRSTSAGTAIAVRSGPNMPNTAAEAAIRAVWAAAEAMPKPMLS
jgi:hypothetical protein